jgi:hypothetical protein
MFSRRSLRNVASAYRENRARARLPPLAGFHSLRSTELSNSFSSVSSFTSDSYHDVCLIGTHWRRLRCARRCAQARSEIHQSAANANQRGKRRRSRTRICARLLKASSGRVAAMTRRQATHKFVAAKQELNCCDELVRRRMDTRFPDVRIRSRALRARSSRGRQSHRARRAIASMVGGIGNLAPGIGPRRSTPEPRRRTPADPTRRRH